MKKFICCLGLLSLLSCKEQTPLQQHYQCSTNGYAATTEEVRDMKKLFSATIPKHWKTNLFYDNVQSSIYTADTTKQLTHTTIVDITFVHQSVNFDEEFIQQITQRNTTASLTKVAAKPMKVLQKEAYLSHAKGTKSGYPYQTVDLFIKVNENNFIQAKTEVYGDSLVTSRICNALHLIEQIKIE